VTDTLERYDCPGCGAEVAFPADVLSTVCAFCETPLVKADAEDREPVDAVAPFVLTARQASGRLKQFMAGRWLAPEALRKASQPEEFRGVLVPFWVYDATARSSWSANIGIHWTETETYTVVVNGKTEVRTRTKRHTDWHASSGTHAFDYRDHLVSGSKGLPETEANALEPFDVGLARPYAPTLLAGVVAEGPSVDHAEAARVAHEELSERQQQAIARFLPGDTHRGLRSETDITVERVRLVLLPVWIATYRHNGTLFRMSVNGQTGEVVGAVPKSWKKVALLVGAVVLVLLLGLLCSGGLVGSASLLTGGR
jgi:hypothetical protein